MKPFVVVSPKLEPDTTVPISMALVNVEELKLALLRSAPVKSACVRLALVTTAPEKSVSRSVDCVKSAVVRFALDNDAFVRSERRNEA